MHACVHACVRAHESEWTEVPMEKRILHDDPFSCLPLTLVPCLLELVVLRVWVHQNHLGIWVEAVLGSILGDSGMYLRTSTSSGDADGPGPALAQYCVWC